MDITPALLLKILGLVIVGTCHRTIARAARAESFGWWITTMFVPGGTIVYSLGRIRECMKILLIMLAGCAVFLGGLGLSIYGRVQEARAIADSQAHEISEPETPDDDESEPSEPTQTQPPQPGVLAAAAPASPATQPAQAVSAPAVATTVPSPPVPSVNDIPKALRPKFEKLMQQYQKLSEERATLKAGDEDRIQSFNLRAADYQSACKQFREILALR